MKKTTTHKLCYLYLLLCVFVVGNLNAQVGINTTTPKGALDVESNVHGIVLPRLALTATNVMAPATNPKSGVTDVPVGTTVFNTNVSATGTNDVTVGIYSWDGSKWIPQFSQEQSELFESITFSLRSRSNASERVTGINGTTFRAKYTGTYRIKVSVNYGGGGAKVPDEGSGSSDGQLNIARQSGVFNLNLGGTVYTFPVHSYSTSYDASVGATNYFAIWQQTNATFYRDFTENEVANMFMAFVQDPAPEFVSNANSFNSGRGYIAFDIPCTVEITFVEEEE